jgi:hypothetical protein
MRVIVICSKAIGVWVCAYRVLLAAVDEVELDEEIESCKVRDIVEATVRWGGPTFLRR